MMRHRGNYQGFAPGVEDEDVVVGGEVEPEEANELELTETVNGEEVPPDEDEDEMIEHEEKGRVNLSMFTGW